MQITINLDPGSFAGGFYGFSAQWERLFAEGETTADVKLRLKYGTKLHECSATVKLSDLYAEKPSCLAISYTTLSKISSLAINMHSIKNAIINVASDPDHSNPKESAIVIFAICEAARFIPFRELLWHVLTNDIQQFDWCSLRGIMNKWKQILVALKIGEPPKSLTMGDLSKVYHNLSDINLDKAFEDLVRILRSIRQSWHDNANGVMLQDETTCNVGQGINVITATGPNVESLKSTLLIPKVYQDKNFIHKTRVNLAESASLASDQFCEIFESKEISAGIKTGSGIAFFTGEISTKYGTSSKLSSTAKFYTAVASVESNKYALAASFALPKTMREIIDPVVLCQIDSPEVTPQELFSTYGTHIVTAASVGGCIQVHGLYQGETAITTTKFGAAIDVGCAYVSASAKAEANAEQKAIISSSNIKCKSYGGDISVVASMHSFEQIKESFSEWAKSIRQEENQVLSKIYEYCPIWCLAESKKRQDQIKNEFLKLAEENYEALAKYFQISTRVSLLTAISTQQGKRSRFLAVMPTDSTIRIIPKPNDFTQFEKVPNSKDTVCFKNLKIKKYMGVSCDPSGKENGMLYVDSATTGPRQEFTLEPVGKLFRMKSLHTGGYVAWHNTPNLFADGSKSEALLFEFPRCVSQNFEGGIDMDAVANEKFK